MSDELSTFGVSKSPEKLVHHVIWYYKFRKNTGILDRIYCKECNTYYPTSKLLIEFHPKEDYILVRQINHIGKNKR